jgi:hypothetical protein
MKADSWSTAKSDAEGWATDLFSRIPKGYMTREGGAQMMAHDFIMMLLDLPHDHLYVRMAVHCALFEGDEMFTTCLRTVAAKAIERGIPLSGALETFVMCFLLAPNMKWRRGKEGEPLIMVDDVKRPPGQDKSAFYNRDWAVVVAINHIVNHWRFPATRRDMKAPSAASIVSTALERSGAALSEPAINKIWNGREAFGEIPDLRRPSETISEIK